MEITIKLYLSLVYFSDFQSGPYEPLGFHDYLQGATESIKIIGDLYVDDGIKFSIF